LYGVGLPEQRLSAIAVGYFIWVSTPFRLRMSCEA
jgi:hypothetical protein